MKMRRKKKRTNEKIETNAPLNLELCSNIQYIIYQQSLSFAADNYQKNESGSGLHG